MGKATGWRGGRCQHVQISELVCMEKCNHALIEFLAATDIRMFLPKLAGELAREKHWHDELRQEVPGQNWISLDWWQSLSRFVNLFVLCFFLILCTWLIFLCHRGRWEAGGSYASLPARPAVYKGGSMLCHTLISENTVRIKQPNKTAEQRHESCHLPIGFV